MEQNKDKGTYEDFLELAGYNDPSQVEIVPTCKVMNVVKMKVFVIELLRQAAGQNPDKIRIFKLIDTAFKAELGLKGENAIWWELAPDDKKPPKKVFVNTTDEAELFPELRQFCEEEIDEKPSCSYSAREKGKAKRYLSLYMEKWREGQETPSKPQPTPEPQPKQKHPQQLWNILPELLRRDDVLAIFQRAIDRGLIEETPDGLKWKDTKQLLAYFVQCVSNKFELTKKLDKDGNITVNWAVFEGLFDIKNISEGKYNWLRIYTNFTPTGYEVVDAIM